MLARLRDVMSRLLSVNVGLPRDIPWQGKTVHTAAWKQPVDGRRTVGRLRAHFGIKAERMMSGVGWSGNM